MGVVILGGLLSSTFLNMLVVPVLFQLFGRPPMARAATASKPSLTGPASGNSAQDEGPAPAG